MAAVTSAMKSDRPLDEHAPVKGAFYNETPSAPPGKVRALGLCLGATAISFALVEQRQFSHLDSRQQPPARVVSHGAQRHEGNPKASLKKTLKHLCRQPIDKIAVTGRALRHLVTLSSIPEPEAVEHAFRFVAPGDTDCRAIVSAGGETFMGYVLNGKGEVADVLSGNKCASGTGEFFIQQIRRMNVNLTEAAQWSVSAKPYRVSGRCAVFCKSDCTHATNKGVPKSRSDGRVV